MFQYFLRGMETQFSKNRMLYQHRFQYFLRGMETDIIDGVFLEILSFNTSLEVWKRYFVSERFDTFSKFQYFLRGMETLRK
ncbi:hypothetical protein Mc24_00155 [Thermotoga sp. Mc24]|nr:hypothetical protein Mc24_00155 [Thermotoga sp. Mc24]